MLELLIPLLLAAAPADETIATVDRRPITASQLVMRHTETKAAGGTPQAENLLADLINEELMAADGYARKLDRAPAVVAAAESARRRVAVERFLEKELYSTIRIDDEQVKALFHDTGDSVHLKVIVLASEAEAKAAIDRLSQGAKFEVEAARSLDPGAAKKGGDLGDLTRGMVDPKLSALAFSAPLNQVLEPVPLSLGIGVVMVVGRQVADEAELPARKAQIVAFATEQSRGVLRRHCVQQMRAKYKVELDEEFLKSTGMRNLATPQEAARVLAQVKGQPVRYGEVLASMAATLGGQATGHMAGLTVKRDFAWNEVDRLVLETAALEAGEAKAPDAVAAGKEAERIAVIRELAAALRAEVPSPSRAEVEASLAANANEFTRPGTRTCSHLVLRSREEAALVRTRLAKGERFEELAPELSIDRSTAARGGLIGEINDNALAGLAQPGREPALAAAMKSPKPQEVSQPIQSKAGWHLVRCGAPTGPQLAKLEEVEKVIVERVRAERGHEAVIARIRQLRASAKVSTDAAAVQRVVASLAGGVR